MQLPQKFEENIRAMLGAESGYFFYAIQQPPVTSIRLNPAKPTRVFFDEEKVAWCKHGRYLKTRPSFIADPLFHAGAYYVQESSSMFLTSILNSLHAREEPANARSLPPPLGRLGGAKILDLCAAPGGKSTLILSAIAENSLLVSNEIIKSRVKILEENLLRWGEPNVFVTNNDPKDFGKLKNYFDVILVDAPCSGEGLFRKDKKAIEEWSEENVNMCAARQQRILADVLPALKPGGFLVYSTCTFNKKENEENIEWLIKNYALEIKEGTTTEFSNFQIFKFSNYRFLPHKVKGEGLFISVLQKPATDFEPVVLRKEKQHTKTANKLKQLAEQWLDDATQFEIIEQNEELIALPKANFDNYNFLNKQLHITQAGIKLGKLAKDGSLIPDHQLALSVHLIKNTSKVELDLKTAHLYLRKQAFQLNQDLGMGWYLATYMGLGLGWLKVLPNRINNYYPAEYRILKEL